MIVLYQSLFYIIVFYYFIIVSCFHLSLASWLLFSNKVQFSSVQLRAGYPSQLAEVVIRPVAARPCSRWIVPMLMGFVSSATQLRQSVAPTAMWDPTTRQSRSRAFRPPPIDVEVNRHQGQLSWSRSNNFGQLIRSVY